jgi:hypothetical protein
MSPFKLVNRGDVAGTAVGVVTPVDVESAKDIAAKRITVSMTHKVKHRIFFIVHFLL